MLLIKYNGVRFPRVVLMKNHQKASFHPEKKVLELDDYTAYRLLSNNKRYARDRWEFEVVSEMPEKPKPPAPPVEEKKPEPPAPKPEKPKGKKGKKGGKQWI